MSTVPPFKHPSTIWRHIAIVCFRTGCRAPTPNAWPNAVWIFTRIRPIGITSLGCWLPDVVWDAQSGGPRVELHRPSRPRRHRSAFPWPQRPRRRGMQQAHLARRTGPKSARRLNGGVSTGLRCGMNDQHHLEAIRLHRGERLHRCGVHKPPLAAAPIRGCRKGLTLIKPVAGEAGSIMLWHGGLFHQARANRSDDIRVGLNIAYYPRWFNNWIEHGHQPIWPETYEWMPPAMQQLCSADTVANRCMSSNLERAEG